MTATATPEAPVTPSPVTPAAAAPAAPAVPAPAPAAGIQPPAGQPSTPATPAAPATPAPAAEIKYDLKLPEGSLLDPAATERTALISKELGLSTSESAQKVLEVIHKEVQTFQDQQMAKYTQVVEKWKADTKADPEIGGEKLAQTTIAAQRAVDRLVEPALYAELERTGFIHNPLVVKFFAKLGASLGDDKPGHPTAPAATEKSPLAGKFPNSIPQKD